jgi:hypothetical protein
MALWDCFFSQPEIMTADRERESINQKLVEEVDKKRLI